MLLLHSKLSRLLLLNDHDGHRHYPSYDGDDGEPPGHYAASQLSTAQLLELVLQLRDLELAFTLLADHWPQPRR